MPGWRLRECLASGRPFVVNGDPVVQDHLDAIGAAAYVYSGPDLPLQAAEATIAALRGHTRADPPPARAAVLAESWSEPAAALVRLLRAGPPSPERRTTATAGELRERRGPRVAVMAPRLRTGSAERFLREIVTELALHPSRPAITLYGSTAGMTSAARATAEALVGNGGGRSTSATRASTPPWPRTRTRRRRVVHVAPPRAAAGGPRAAGHDFHDLHWRFFWTFLADEVREIESDMPAWLESTALFVSSSEFIRGQLCEEYEVERGRTRVVPLTGMRPLPVSREAAAAVRRRSASRAGSCSSPRCGARTRTTWRCSGRSSCCARRAGR